jgi:SAM-dependent methyltransferase
VKSDDSYDRYVRAEWELFSRDPARGALVRDAVSDLRVERVLDIGCGAGQQLRPFLQDGRTLGIGSDISPEVGRAGRELFQLEQRNARVAFVQAAAERLPFCASSFDLVICRLALPYTDNARAFAEMARVLRSGGAVLLTFHHPRYYVLKLVDAVRSRHVKSGIHACRVLLAGAVYLVTGSQPRGRLTGGETFQTMRMLRRELAPHGLAVRAILPGSVPAAPSVRIEKVKSEKLKVKRLGF